MTKQYEEDLKKSKPTKKDLKKQIDHQLLVTKYMESKIGKVDVTDEEVKSMAEQY
jgi:hypothetical protein